MSVRLTTLTIVGFLVGALAAGGIGVGVIREVRALDDATSLPPQNTARSDGHHVDPHESILSSVSLVPDTAAFDDEGLTVTYRLTSLAPSLGSVAPGEEPVLYPRTWKAEALGGEFVGAQADPNDPTVVFPLLAGGRIDQIDGVSIVDASIPAPFEQRVWVDSHDGSLPSVQDDSLPEGVAIEIVDQVTDRDTTTLMLRIQADPASVRDVSIVGDGPGYHPAVVDGDIVTLTRQNRGNLDDDTALPGDFNLIVFGTRWVPTPGEFPVDLGAVDE